MTTMLQGSHRSVLAGVMKCDIVVNEFELQSRYYPGSLNKFLDLFRMGTFIDRTHMKL